MGGSASKVHNFAPQIQTLVREHEYIADKKFPEQYDRGCLKPLLPLRQGTFGRICKAQIRDSGLCVESARVPS